MAFSLFERMNIRLNSSMFWAHIDKMNIKPAPASLRKDERARFCNGARLHREEKAKSKQPSPPENYSSGAKCPVDLAALMIRLKACPVTKHSIVFPEESTLEQD